MTEEKYCELMHAWKLGEGISLRLYREDNDKFVLRVVDEAVDWPSKITDEVGMSSSIAKSLGRYLTKHANVAKASNGNPGLPRFAQAKDDDHD